ncbi:MAG: MFS transporter [Candidatus Bathyarchaeia archaeon]|jgi:MFS family permease
MLSEQERFRFYVSVFVASLGFGMYQYFMPVFAQTFGASYFDLGVIGTVWSLAQASTPMLAGHLADRLNRAWIFSFSLGLNGLATFMLIFSRSVSDIVVLQFVGGIGLGVFWPTAEMIVTDLTPIDKRVREMGRYGIALVLGSLIGPLIGGLLIERLNYSYLFVSSSAVITVSFVQVIIWVVPSYSSEEFSHPQNVSGNLRIIRRLIPWYLMLICDGVIWGLITSIFPGYAYSVGISALFIGLLFTGFALARIFSYATAHRYLRFGEKRMLVSTSLMISAGIIVLGVLPSFPAFLLGIMLIGGGTGVIFPITISLISRQFPEDSAGAGIGSYETSMNIGQTGGPYLAGVLASLTSIRYSFLAMSIFGGLMALFAAKGQTYSSGCKKAKVSLAK